MQSQPFAITKIQPPRPRAGFIARPALDARLREAAATRRLVLVVAPAGFGKTAAVSRLGAQAPEGSALVWVSVDEDDDLHRFLACLIAALEPFDPPWRTDPDALLASASRSRAERREAAAAVLNVLAACEVPQGRIVFDDMHRISDPTVFEFLDLLLERLPEPWCVVLCSRIEPPLALARLRAGDDVAEFHLHDMQFDADEVSALVDATPGARSLALDATQLQQRTHGWPAGLSIMLRTGANRLANKPDGKAEPRAALPQVVDRHVFDYLASEVLDGMSDELRAFLLRCSVLPELTATRCAAVSGNPQAAALLDEIDRRGLFVTVLDGNELTLRLHDLFRDFLDDRLAREMPGELSVVLLRAATSEPDAVRRVGYLIRAGAWDESAATLGELGRPLIAAGAVEPVLRLIEQFPSPMRGNSATLSLTRGLCAWARWDFSTMRDAMQRAWSSYEAIGNQVGAARALVYEAMALACLGRLADARRRLADLRESDETGDLRVLASVARSWFAGEDGNLSAPSYHYANALDALEASNDPLLWYQSPPRLIHLGLPGMRAPLQRFVDGTLRRFGETASPLRGIARGVAAWLALDGGDVQRAADWLVLAQEDERWVARQTNVYMIVQTVRSLIALAQGHAEAAAESTDAVLAYFDSPAANHDERMRSASGHYVYLALRVAQAFGRDDDVRRFAARMPDANLVDETAMRHQRIGIEPRLIALEGDAKRRIAAWGNLIEREAKIDVFGQAVEVRMRAAAAWLELGRTVEAASVLEPAFARVKSSGGGGASGVLLAGAAVRSALACADWGECLSAAQCRELRQWERWFALDDDAVDAAPTGSAGSAVAARATAAASNPSVGGSASMSPSMSPSTTPSVPPSASTASPLSQRELEVLERLAAGESNKVIARDFDLSPHTVKRHVANILDKLGLQSRGQAAAWFRAHSSA